jgi:hypothetical protein
VYARKIGEDVLDFGHRGWLRESSFLFYDYKTDSLWVQATGECIDGHFKGTHLKRLPATQTTWSQWRTLQPQTRVLGRSFDRTLQYENDVYADYYATGRSPVKDHHGPLHFGLALIMPRGEKLYPFKELEKRRVISDSVGGQDVLVVFHAQTKTAVAFDPHHDGKRLDFGAPELKKTDLLLTDRQTGSRWSGLTGLCVDGPARGARLQQLISTQFVIENWKLHYPAGHVYGMP